MASPKIQHTSKQTFLHHLHVQYQSHSQAPILLNANNGSLALTITLLLGRNFIHAMCFALFEFIVNGVLLTTFIYIFTYYQYMYIYKYM